STDSSPPPGPRRATQNQAEPLVDIHRGIKLDAVWLAKLAGRGMVRASFVPPKPVRQLRDLTRTRTVFIQERTRHKHRVDKALQDAQIKLSDVVSDLFGLSGRAMPDALVAGERNPRALAELRPRGVW
ncbi:transposase, partial [Streptomyces sp. NPDC057910]|uniref:IS110 family transposase n=1 Tax=Streptomyces sp. NPDC057910 TaxID=3346278 RepID=UPI0036EC5862